MIDKKKNWTSERKLMHPSIKWGWVGLANFLIQNTFSQMKKYLVKCNHSHVKNWWALPLHSELN